MAIVIRIETDNAAFQDNGMAWSFDREVAYLLKELARRFAAGQEPSKVMDSNGNTVGTVAFEEECRKCYGCTCESCQRHEDEKVTR